MNLSSDAWIPIVWSNGAAGTVSLSDAFLRGRDIRDLAVRPHERIALMRLLLCVAHAALDGPTDRDDWTTCLDRLPTEAARYLRQWKAAFELLGNGPRFLQAADLVSAKANDEEGNSVSKLDLALATGNNATLFDNSGGAVRKFTPEQLALMLLTFQCFSLQTPFGVAIWDGKPTRGSPSKDNPTGAAKNGKTYAGDAPCVGGGMLHAIVCRDTLLDTIWANLPTKEQVGDLPGYECWGAPAWEKTPSGPDDDSLARTFLGRLVPLARAILLSDDRTTAVVSNGLHYSAPRGDGVREIMGTVFVSAGKQAEKRVLLRADENKALWRQLHAVSVIRKGHEDVGGPLALGNLEGNSDFVLWAGALIPTNSAKIVDVIEASYPLPATMLQSTGQRCYEKGVNFAENTARKLGNAVHAYHCAIGDDLGRRQAKERREDLQNKAAFQFWTQAEHKVPLLLVTVRSDNHPADDRWSQTDWGQAIRHSAREAYEFACPRQTARQMQAFVKGLPCLSYTRDHNQPR